ncbi:MAG TPA: sigma-70 family RNA polymerase sigma factor, partial [Gaiellaceae bacterium]|nr:sigma-70 family RNA polymerase sigma factor [Gaiellaceae bacterium]
MVAVPSIGRASGITPRRAAREADATRELYERYARQIYSFCYRQLGSKEEAEDATQSTFLNAFRGYMRGVDPEYESAWIYKIAENVCLTRQRSSTRRRRVEAASDLDAMQDFVPAHQSDSDELIRLPEALDAMPEQQRRALLLREWQGLSYKEIAEELDLSQAAVETLLFRARRSLAAGLTAVPAQPKKGIAKRMRAGGDLGSLVTLVKSILFTGGAKVAATVATVAATSVVAATPVARHAVEHVVDPAPAPAKHHVAKQPTTKTSSRSVTAPHLAGARAAALVALHSTVGARVPVSHAHRAVAKHVATARVASAAMSVHAAPVNHVDSTTNVDPTTAATVAPPAAADPTPPTTAS